MDWQAFFPPGTAVVALPNWKHPKVFVNAANRNSIWQNSDIYPAYKPAARAAKHLIRLFATISGLSPRVTSSDWDFRSFIEHYLQGAIPCALMLGTPGKTQKHILRLRTNQGATVYMKYGATEQATKRIIQETQVLKKLPAELGPLVVGCASVIGGEALLVSALTGETAPRMRTPSPSVISYLAQLPRGDQFPAIQHPWLTRLTAPVHRKTVWMEALMSQAWPIVPMHGDFAPWNLVQSEDGSIRAFDWEYGTSEGLPGIDLAFFILQTQALIYRTDPATALRHATRTVSTELRVSEVVGFTLAQLAAYHAYRSAEEDGLSPHAQIQQWRHCAFEQLWNT
jgi:hypothetical protein